MPENMVKKRETCGYWMKTYQWVLLLLVGRWELSNDCFFEQVVLVDTLIIGLELTLLEPDLDAAEFPFLNTSTSI